MNWRRRLYWPVTLLPLLMAACYVLFTVLLAFQNWPPSPAARVLGTVLVSIPVFLFLIWLLAWLLADVRVKVSWPALLLMWILLMSSLPFPGRSLRIADGLSVPRQVVLGGAAMAILVALRAHVLACSRERDGAGGA